MKSARMSKLISWSPGAESTRRCTVFRVLARERIGIDMV